MSKLRFLWLSSKFVPEMSQEWLMPGAVSKIFSVILATKPAVGCKHADAANYVQR